MGVVSPGISSVWSMDIMSVALGSVTEKSLDAVKKGRVSDREKEATVDTDKESPVEKAPETIHYVQAVPQRIERKNIQS